MSNDALVCLKCGRRITGGEVVARVPMAMWIVLGGIAATITFLLTTG